MNKLLNFASSSRRRFEALNRKFRWSSADWYPLHSPKGVFCHVPKAAGTSIYRWLEEETNLWSVRSRNIPLDKPKPEGNYVLYLGHLSPDLPVRLGLLEPNQLETAFSFTFVRHPITRMQSLHRHFIAHDGFEGSFLDFLVLVKDPAAVTSQQLRKRIIHMSRPMTYWARPQLWNGLSRVFRIEDLEQAIPRLRSALSISGRPKQTVSTRQIVRPIDTVSARESALVESIFLNDFEEFGYALN